MNITQTSPHSGEIIGEDNKVYNVVSLLGGGNAVQGAVSNASQNIAVSGRIIGEDNKIYNLVDLLENVGKKQEVIDNESTEAVIKPNALYEYGAVEELELTLSDEIGEYNVVFESGTEPTALSILSEKELLWHNEPVVLANKVYCMAIDVGSTYARAVLSYAE